jgi:iron(III) transport system permease protein
VTRRRPGPEVAGLLLGLVLAWLVLLPLAFVLIEAVRGPEGWSLEAVRRFAAQPPEWRAVWNSLWLSVASVAGAGLLGVPLALVVSRVRFPGRRVVGTLIALPAVLPPLVGVIAFLFLYGETGFVAHLVQAVLGTTQAPWQLQGPVAVLFVHVTTMYVYFYLFVRAGLAGIDASVYEAAVALGAGPWRTLRQVTLPLLRPHLTGAGLLVLMTSLASFSAPYLFGGSFRVMTTQIMATKLNGDDRLAMVETLSLTLLALAGLALVRRLEGRGAPGLASKGVPPPPRPLASRWGRLILPAVAWGMGLLLVLPHLALVVVSLVPRGTWTVQPLPPVLSLGNYAALVRDPVRLAPIITSSWMATVATGLAVVLVVATGVLAVRRRVLAGRFLEAVTALPWAVPGTVFAIALATAFSVHAPWAGRVVLVGTPWILPIAYLVRNLPVTGRVVLAGFRQLDPSLEESAATLGAGQWRVVRRVTLPLLRPALVAGASLAFVTAFGDFVTSILLYTYDTRPISLEILGSLRQSDMGIAAAYGVLLMAVSAAVFYVAGDRGEQVA